MATARTTGGFDRCSIDSKLIGDGSNPGTGIGVIAVCVPASNASLDTSRSRASFAWLAGMLTLRVR